MTAFGVTAKVPDPTPIEVPEGGAIDGVEELPDEAHPTKTGAARSDNHHRALSAETKPERFMVPGISNMN